MPATFTRTVRSLSTDRVRSGNFCIALAMLLMAAWAAWFCWARVSVYEVAETARLEVTGLSRPVVSVCDAQVRETRLVLGQTVVEGEVVMQLDDQLHQAARAVAQEQLVALQHNLTAATSELSAERRAATAEIQAAAVALEEIRAHIEEARARADYSDQRLARIRILHEKRAVAEEDLSESLKEASVQNAAWRAWQLALSRRQADQRVQESDREARIQELEHDRTEVSGQLRTQAAVLDGVQRELELRQVKAPITGRVGQVSDFPAGSFVKTGQPVAFIVPAGRPRAVAYFPTTAVSRIRSGQAARLRLDGFPWTQYGSLPATVAHVAAETERDLLRVELEVSAAANLALPTEHGVPASAEVTVERLSPAALVLRAIGRMLRSHPAARVSD